MKPAFSWEAIAKRRFAAVIALACALCIAAAAFYLPAGFVRIAVLAMLGLPALFIALDRPALVFYGLIVILFSNLDLFTTFRLYRLLLALAVFALALAVINGRPFVRHHPVLLFLVAVFAVVLFQSISIARDYDAAAALALKYFKNLLAVAIAVQFVRTPGEFRRYVLVMAIAILLTDLAPLVVSPPTRYGSLSLIWEQGVFRYEGFVFEPNAFALMQLMLIPMLMYLIAVYRRSKPAVVCLSLALLASVVVLALSFSRGGFLGLAVLFALLLVVERKSRTVIAIGASIIVAGVALAPTIYWDRIQSMISFAQGSRFDFSIFTRIEAMKEAVRLGAANPLLGIGADNFIYALGSSLPYRMIVHNAYLQVFAELGAIAFAAFIAVITYDFLLIRSLMRRRDPEAAQIGRLLLIQLAAVLASAFFIPVAYDYYFWFVLAFPAIADYCFRGGAQGDEVNSAAARAAGSIPRA
jgi:O-antigen ligase